jgi:hypothetical protein
MAKTKTLEEHLEIAPPVPEAISAKYLIRLPVNDSHFESDESLNSYAQLLLRRKLGDEVDLKSIRVKNPGIASRTMARIHNRVPQAKLYATVDF